MLPSFRPQQSNSPTEGSGAAASRPQASAGPLAGVLPWQRPVVDVMSGEVCGHDLSYPPGFVRPLYGDADYSHEQFAQDFAWRRDWVVAAHLAGLAQPGRWLLLPVNSGLAGRHPEALAELLVDTRMQVLGTPLSALRVVIQFDAALHEEYAAQSLALIRVFRSQGFAIAINGFGDGFDSRQDLIDAAPDLLRLSPTLTHGLEQDRHRRSIVSALVGMAQELGIDLIADEVESHAQAARLLALGVRLQTGQAHGALEPLAIPAG